MPTPTVENYVKQLYLEQQRTPGDLLPLGRLAAAMGVVPGTVTTMVRTLADAGLVRYEPRAGVALTGAGERLALHVLRRHRLVELFLVRVLGFDWSEVHDEAEELEHVVSDKLLERMDALLGRPSVDPHGDPIPDADGRVGTTTDVSLAECAAGERVVIARVDNQDAAFLRFATRSRLTPGRELTIEAVDEAADTVTVRPAEGDPVALGRGPAAFIRVSRDARGSA